MGPSKKFIIIVVCLVALVGLGGYGIKWTSTPGFCSTCHQIKPAVTSWQNGSHASIGCLECHADPGAYGKFKVKVGGLKELAVQAVASPSGETVIAEVSSERCRECHWAVSFINRDLAKVHWGKEVNCGPCHRHDIHKTAASI